jgi:hypothetical protein
MLIINNRFLSLYDYNFLLVIEKIFSLNFYEIQLNVEIKLKRARGPNIYFPALRAGHLVG